MDQQERQFEITKLALTLKQVQEQIKISEQDSSNHQYALQVTTQEYWATGNTNSVDEAQLIETMNRQRALSSHTFHIARQLCKMLVSPYFGRIDFAEANLCQAEKIYIGIGSLTDQVTGEFLVYDWRAPVSSMFYDYGRGQASYRCPAGTITGTISLKRQFKITNGIIEYMFDSDLKIDDEILRELLGKSADDKMHTIVNSIQREQNQIIRDDKHKVLFVEGPAGSGKTSVALHRVAFLLYQDRERLTSQNVLILSPNHIFSEYISNVLPEIGEENVLQMTFQDYATRSTAQIPLQFETRAAYIEHILTTGSSKKRAANIRFKSSSRFSEALTNYLEWLSSDWINEHPAVKVRGEILFRQDEWRHYYVGSFGMMPPLLRLEKIRTILQKRMRKIVHTVRMEKEAELIKAGEEINEKVIKALARIQARDELKPITDQIDQLTTLDVLTEYIGLFQDNRLFEATKMVVPAEWKEIRTQTLDSINRGILPFEDIPPFLYFQGVLQGFTTKTDIKHVVIDEAQDYTSFHYKILVRLFPNCSWTIVGDPAQIVQPFLITASFDEAGNILGREYTLLVRLNKSYRSTREIQNFCQALLPNLCGVQSVNRPGPRPNIITLDSIISKTISEILNEGWHSIGIITKTATQAATVYHKLKGLIVNLTLVVSEEDQFHPGVVIIPSYLAKGLEFDAVLVMNVDASNFSHEQDRHILYTICSRALHRLYLYYSGHISPFLVEIDPNLYNVL